MWTKRLVFGNDDGLVEKFEPCLFQFSWKHIIYLLSFLLALVFPKNFFKFKSYRSIFLSTIVRRGTTFWWASYLIHVRWAFVDVCICLNWLLMCSIHNKQNPLLLFLLWKGNSFNELHEIKLYWMMYETYFWDLRMGSPSLESWNKYDHLGYYFIKMSLNMFILKLAIIL